MTANSFGKRQPAEPGQAPEGEGSKTSKDLLAQIGDMPLPQKIACLWPLLLVFVGGFIGGACGGGACAINIRIMRGSLPGPAKYALAVLTGLGALAVYLFLVILLAVLFPDIFARQG